jgi:non-heme Fe2+,alpha-ketoglutarate-dependent halogenase
MEMRAGEAVMFTARCVHASHPNSSQRKTRFAMTTRFVPTSVRVYPDWKEFHAHGGHFNLEKWGCVLVAGEDKYGHNIIKDHDNWGTPFARHKV